MEKLQGQPEIQLRDIENLYSIQNRLVELGQRVPDGYGREPFPGKLSELMRLYGKMTGDIKDAGLKNLIAQLTALKTVNKSQNSSWYLLRMITDLTSDVQFKEGGMIDLWNSWLREEYEGVVAKNKYNSFMVQDLVKLTNRLRKTFSHSVQVLEDIDRVGQVKVGLSEWEEKILAGHYLPKINEQNVTLSPPKPSLPISIPLFGRSTSPSRISPQQVLSTVPPTHPTANGKGSSTGPASEPKQNVLRPSKLDLQRQFEKLRALQKDLIPTFKENNEEQATQMLSKLKQLYNEVDVKVQVEGVEDLPFEIECYMQTNGISSSWYFLWVISHLIAEIQFSKRSLQDLWTEWIRGKYNSLVFQCDMTDPQYPELISMAKLLGHVYNRGGCIEIVPEIAGVGTPKYGTRWIKSNRPYAPFPDTRDRIRYITISSVNGDKERRGTTSTGTGQNHLNTVKPLPKRKSSPTVTPPDKATPVPKHLAATTSHLKSPVPPPSKQKESTQGIPPPLKSWFKEKFDQLKKSQQSKSAPPIYDDQQKDNPKESTQTTVRNLESDADLDAVVERVKTALNQSPGGPITTSKSILKSLKQKSSLRDEDGTESKEGKFHKSKSKSQSDKTYCNLENLGPTTTTPDIRIQLKGSSTGNKQGEDDSIKLGNNSSPGTTGGDEVIPASSRKRKNNSNPIIIPDLLDKPLDPLTVKVPQPSSTASWWPNAKSNTTTSLVEGTTEETVPKMKRRSKSSSSSSSDTGNQNNNEHQYQDYEYDAPPEVPQTPFQQAKRKIERSQIQNAKSAVVRINGDIKEHYLPKDFSNAELIDLILSPNFISLSTKPFGGYNVQCVGHYINREVKGESSGDIEDERNS